MKHPRRKHLSVPEKANRLLSGVVVGLIIIALRLWHLAVIEHDNKLEEAYKPQKRTIPELVERATICDRFGHMLAENTMQYDVSITYSSIRDLPSRAWHSDASGERKLIPVRKQYIQRLSQFLADELHLDADMIEDSIHSKASILGSVPYLIQPDISERMFLKLKMLAKDWPGLHVEAKVKRHYPAGKVAADLLGYVGPISSHEYKKITQELSRLRECVRAYEEGENPKLPNGLSSIDQVRTLLTQLENNAYNLNALVGKLGIEAYCDRELRGQIGKKTILVDRRGNFIQELYSEPVTHGTKVQLTLSTELQEFADCLLLEHEKIEQMRSAKLVRDRNSIPSFFPWIKGGAIIAMDPNTGQILAMSSSPRYENNDFMQKGVEAQSSVCRWLENVTHIGEVYDCKTPLRRERVDSHSGSFYDEELWLTFDAYLEFILPMDSEVKAVLKQCNTVAHAVHIQEELQAMLSLFGYQEGKCSCAAIFDSVFPEEEGHIPTKEVNSLRQQRWIASCLLQHQEELGRHKKKLQVFFASLPANYDKMLLVDLYRLLIDSERIPVEIFAEVGSMSLSEFSESQGHYVALRSAFAKIMEEVFYAEDFKTWKKEHFSAFLQAKRQEEQERGQRYPTPYIDYLLEERRAQYRAFSRCHLDQFIVYLLSGKGESAQLAPYYSALAAWRAELLGGAHKALPWYKHYAFLQKRALSFPSDLLQFVLSFREFAELQRPLLGKYPVMITRNNPQIEQDLAAAFYPTYGFGYLRPHSFGQAATLGSIFKLVSAYSVLSQYIDLDYDPAKLFVMMDKKSFGLSYPKSHVGFFKDGSPIPSFFKGGNIPGNDFSGRGWIDLIAALEMSSNPYFSLLVSEYLKDPEDLCSAAASFGFGEKTGVCLSGEYAGGLPVDIAYNRSGLYATAIGQHTLVVTPLQTAVMLSAMVNGGQVFVPNLILGEWKNQQFIPTLPIKKRDVFMPQEIENLLKSGMQKVIWGNYGTTRSVQSQFPKELLQRVIGKTSTAEVISRVGLDRQHGTMKLKHVWFAAAGFEDEGLSRPEIVVIVYLRFGDFGRDAAPIAIKMIDKWEQLCKKYGDSSTCSSFENR